MKTTKIIISSVASTLIVSAIVYAATITGVGPQTLNTGDTIGNGWFQQVNDGVASANPSGAIMAFNLASCPTGWSEADGAGGRPDLRGEFIRGLDRGRGIDVGRTLATAQADELKSHNHGGVFSPSGSSLGDSRQINYSSLDGVTASTGGAETRPRNVAFLYCIKN